MTSLEPAAKPIALSVVALEVAYRDVTAVWDVTFDVGEGEIVALVGANGAGKTTTLKTISGLLRPRTGSIRLDGEDLTRLPAKEIVARGRSRRAGGCPARSCPGRAGAPPARGPRRARRSPSRGAG